MDESVIVGEWVALPPTGGTLTWIIEEGKKDIEDGRYTGKYSTISTTPSGQSFTASGNYELSPIKGKDSRFGLYLSIINEEVALEFISKDTFLSTSRWHETYKFARKFTR